MAKKMLIDATHPEETRVVVADGARVDDFDFESVNKRQLAGNIYLAKVTRVEPSLQAAFVEYGGNRHGFLAFSEIHPDYYQIPVADREALLAEEEEAERAAEAEEEARAKAKSSRSRRRSRSSAKAAEATDADETTSSEVIAESDEDLLVETPEGDAAAEPAEATADEAEVATAEGDDATTPEPTEDAAAEAAPDEDGDDSHTEEAVEAVAQESAEEASNADGSDEPTAEANEPSDDSEASDDSHSDDADENTAQDDTAETRHEARPRRQRQRRYKIQEVVKVRQVMLVQVVKEERGNKGAALTTYLSLAGRYCVLMPNTARGGGISRKITTATDRKKLKEIATDLEVPQGAGLIIRTAGAKRTKTEIKRDYEFLIRQWDQIRDLTMSSVAPTLIYEEGSLIKRAIRDLYGRDIDEIHVEGPEGYREAKDYMRMLMPSHAKNVRPYNDPTPLFTRHQVEATLGAMFDPTVQLKSGGYIVIGVTEALVAIDVNSGRATKEGSIEETALKTNLEAAEEAARQMKLRDLAGLIVIDFIDMDERRNNVAVEKRLKDALKNDRARIQVGRISSFGLMEMSRQRLRPGMIEMVTQPCPHCQGTGLVRSDASLALSVLRDVQEEANRRRAKELVVVASVAVVNYLINYKREAIALIEGRFGISIRVEADPSVPAGEFRIDRLKTATRLVSQAAETAAVQMDAVYDDLETEIDDAVEDEAVAEEPEAESDEDDQGKKKRRRRRGGRRRKKSDGEAQENGEAFSDDAAEASDETSETGASETEAESESDEEAKKPKPRKRSRGRRRKSDKDETAEVTTEEMTGEVADAAAETSEPVAEAPAELEPTEEPAAAKEDTPAEVTADAPGEVADDATTEVAEEPAAETPEPETQPEPAQEQPSPEPQVAETETDSSGRVWTPPEDTPPKEDAPKKRGWWRR
ncbi:MAG: Rne/Rng family ribonuclease [Pseudomonadota bacterium]